MSLCQLQTCVVDTQLGLPKLLSKRAKPAFGVGNRRASSGPFCERDCAERRNVRERNNASRDFVQRLIPTDALPYRDRDRL